MRSGSQPSQPCSEPHGAQLMPEVEVCAWVSPQPGKSRLPVRSLRAPGGL